MNLLIIDNNATDWGTILSDLDINIHIRGWNDIELSSYSDSGAYVKLYPNSSPIQVENQNETRIVKPDLLLIRNVIKGPSTNMNFVNKLYGFMHSSTPSINSLFSIYNCLERPIVYGELKKIQKKLGNENFPLIQQTYYSSFSEMIITPDYPLVTKIGHSHAGFGKMLLERHDQFIDLSSVLALYNDYCTAERFIDSDYEIRIQKIGSDISAFKRTGFEWKRNTGGAMIEDIEVLPRYKTWINECGKMFGGLDIMSLDILVTKDNKEIILELNDTATGLAGKRPEDFQSVKKLIINKIQEISTK